MFSIMPELSKERADLAFYVKDCEIKTTIALVEERWESRNEQSTVGTRPETTAIRSRLYSQAYDRCHL
jgi:hypothetical protein